MAGSHRTILRRITWTRLSFKRIPPAAARIQQQGWKQEQMGGGDCNGPDERWWLKSGRQHGLVKRG